ncbi:hypothetical protein Acsp06_50570 [Actinomycetospora sp. NBRC 106375]|uniref:hypothetical protein n=1 Tax=Actinomycetospora sp. NBRC 106375 TaxID=3032207 RepID=UPI0024A34B51|nr:hypothetical protein [Actinomycetospora sp. NBRC 106375]GLZ48872.1 hypothetical protein Acsp06_50570 [Actinomycetospora sp. NBRC 106375]
MSTPTVDHARHRRVPVEHRWFGIDRRTLPWAVVAAAVWALWVLLVPAVNDAIAWSDQTRPGDVLLVAREGVTVVPPVGWGLQSGLRTTDRPRAAGGTAPPILLGQEGVQILVRSAAWSGSTADLLDSASGISVGQAGGSLSLGDPQNFTTLAGLPGLVRSTSSPRADGLLAAVVVGGTGVEVTVKGPPDQVRATAEPVRRMLTSISRSGS